MTGTKLLFDRHPREGAMELVLAYAAWTAPMLCWCTVLSYALAGLLDHVNISQRARNRGIERIRSRASERPTRHQHPSFYWRRQGRDYGSSPAGCGLPAESLR
jgi:hypothetical protein